METAPHDPPTAPLRIDSLTLGNQIAARVTELAEADTGGSPIRSYHLQVDQLGGGAANSPTWVDVAGAESQGDSLLLTHTLQRTAGTTYYFRYRARNDHGWSAGPTGWSPVQVSLLAARAAAPAVVRATNSGLDVVLSWDPPTSDGNSAVDGYTIQVRASNGLFEEEPDNCAGMGAHRQAILSLHPSLSCTIPMTKMTDPATFDLAEGALIVAVVEAHNEIGFSAPSPENTDLAGARVQVVPAAPSSAPQRGAATSEAALVILFPPYAADGGATILAYGLEVDRSDG